MWCVTFNVPVFVDSDVHLPKLHGGQLRRAGGRAPENRMVNAREKRDLHCVHIMIDSQAFAPGGSRRRSTESRNPIQDSCSCHRPGATASLIVATILRCRPRVPPHRRISGTHWRTHSRVGVYVAGPPPGSASPQTSLSHTFPLRFVFSLCRF